jgi:hypothetical protein
MADLYSSGPAFPGTVYTHSGHISGHSMGMSLRDWFAGQALAGILAGGFADTIPHDDVNGGGDAAYFAYQYADAMLSRRQEGLS